MKKLLLSLAVFSAVAATAQVGINTDAPEAMLDISAKDDQKGDLRIQDVEEDKSTQWLLVWDEKDQKVKRTSLSALKWDIIVGNIRVGNIIVGNIIVDNIKGKIRYIRDKHPDKADEIINKMKQCAPENILFDKHFGDGMHDFVYCAETVSVDGYSRTWLNLNLGAEYANINSPNFNPIVNKTGAAIHSDKNLYGSYYQWQRASDGHEFKSALPTTEKAPSWTDAGASTGKYIVTGGDEDANWVENGENASGPDLELWRAGGVNNPCPSGYHVPTLEEWKQFHEAVTGSSFVLTNQMWIQDKLPNLAAAGSPYYYDGSSPEKRQHLGHYWSSSASGSKVAHHMILSDYFSAMSGYYLRAYGFSVRCIKDNN